MMGEEIAIQLISNDTAPGEVREGRQFWTYNTVTFLSTTAIYASINVVCICLVAMCLIYVAIKYSRRKEERDKLGEIISKRFWNYECEIASAIQIISKMKEVTLFRDITAFHILSYKYRTDNGVYDINSLQAIQSSLPKTTNAGSLDVFTVLKNIERLFDSLTLQLPYNGKCSTYTAETIGSTLLSLAQITSLMWCDEKARIVNRVIRFFSGPVEAEMFERDHMGDVELETMVLSKIPYVTNLHLNYDYFILKDCELFRHEEKAVDIMKKICYIDRILASDGKLLRSQEKTIVEVYYSARDLCLKNNIILSKMYFPDIVSRMGEPSKMNDCISCLHHLLRLMSYGNNFRKMETEAAFMPFLNNLYETLYNLVNMSADLELIELSRSNIISYLNGLTAEQILMDREFTKAKLELIEKDLWRHLNYLASRPVGKEDKGKRPAKGPVVVKSHKPASPVHSTSSYLSRQLKEGLGRKSGSLLMLQGSIEHGLKGTKGYSLVPTMTSTSESMLPLLREHTGLSLVTACESFLEDENDFFETPV